MNAHLTRWLPVAFALAFFLQGYFGDRAKSLTWDEPVFIASGYSYLMRNDFRLNREAPPLLQQLEALPLLGMPLRMADVRHPFWQKAEHIAFARDFVRANAADIPTIARRARLPILLIGAGLVYAIFAWGRRLYGTNPALAAAALAASSPNLLAHAKVATTDLGCAAFMFFAVFAFWRALYRDRWLLCGLVTGLALLTKYTALLLGPIYLIIGLLLLQRRSVAPRTLFRGALIIALIAPVVIGAGYNFSFDLRPYVRGLHAIYANAQPGYQFYLLGHVSDRPWWYYYLVAFAIKTPLSTLLLFGIGLAVILKHPAGREQALFLLVPAGLIFAASCFDETNLGYRRILPALPFLLLFCGHAFFQAPSRRRTAVAIGLIALSALAAVRIYPHHLSYFNTLAGGPAHGPYLLDDSNIDWGQDLPGLAVWQHAHPDARPLKLLYFGNVPPDIYGVTAQPMEQTDRDILAPKPGYYAISAHNLAWFRKLKARYKVDSDWLAKYRPIDRVGYSIYIYKFPESANPAQQ